MWRWGGAGTARAAAAWDDHAACELTEQRLGCLGLGLELYQGDSGLTHQADLTISTLVDISSPDAWQAIRAGWDGHVLVLAGTEGGKEPAGGGQAKALTPLQRAFATAKRWVRLTGPLRKRGSKRAASVRFCISVDGVRTCLRLLLLPEDSETASSAKALLPQEQQALLEAQLVEHKRRCLVGLLVVEAAPATDSTLARAGTPFSSTFAGAATPAAPATPSAATAADAALQPADTSTVIAAAAPVVIPAQLTAAAPVAVPSLATAAPKERLQRPSPEDVLLPPPPSPPPLPLSVAPSPPPLPLEQWKQPDAVEADCASKAPGTAAGSSTWQTTSFQCNKKATRRLVSSPANALDTGTEEPNEPTSTCSKRRRSSPSVSRRRRSSPSGSSRRRSRAKSSGSRSEARSKEPHHADPAAPEKQQPAPRQKRWDQRPEKGVDAQASRQAAAPGQCSPVAQPPAAVGAQSPLPRMEVQRLDQPGRTEKQPSGYSSLAAALQQHPPMFQEPAAAALQPVLSSVPTNPPTVKLHWPQHKTAGPATPASAVLAASDGAAASAAPAVAAVPAASAAPAAPAAPATPAAATEPDTAAAAAAYAAHYQAYGYQPYGYQTYGYPYGYQPGMEAYYGYGAYGAGYAAYKYDPSQYAAYYAASGAAAVPGPVPPAEPQPSTAGGAAPPPEPAATAAAMLPEPAVPGPAPPAEPQASTAAPPPEPAATAAAPPEPAGPAEPEPAAIAAAPPQPGCAAEPAPAAVAAPPLLLAATAALPSLPAATAAATPPEPTATAAAPPASSAPAIEADPAASAVPAAAPIANPTAAEQAATASAALPASGPAATSAPGTAAGDVGSPCAYSPISDESPMRNH